MYRLAVGLGFLLGFLLWRKKAGNHPRHERQEWDACVPAIESERQYQQNRSQNEKKYLETRLGSLDHGNPPVSHDPFQMWLIREQKSRSGNCEKCKKMSRQACQGGEVRDMLWLPKPLPKLESL